MKHLRNLKQARLDRPSVAAIGVFDGLHIGHQALIKGLVEQAHASRRLAVVITFFPHPDKLLRDVDERYYLMPPQRRAELMLELGVDYVITLPFDAGMRQMAATDFVDELVCHLNIRELWVGADFALGYQREGNVAFLKAQGRERGFAVNVIELMATESGGQIIGSSQIRQHVRRGEMEQVTVWLGRAYALAGEVVHGQRRGAAIGFPTANIAVWIQQIIPGRGVYAGRARLGSEVFKAVTNIGVRPTFGGKDLTVETHLLDFAGDIYGRQLEVSFEAQLRGEQKFAGLDALAAQIKLDIEASRAYLDAVETPAF